MYLECSNLVISYYARTLIYSRLNHFQIIAQKDTLPFFALEKKDIKIINSC